MSIKWEMLLLRFHRAEKKWLQRQARKRDVSMSEIVREIVREKMNVK